MVHRIAVGVGPAERAPDLRCRDLEDSQVHGAHGCDPSRVNRLVHMRAQRCFGRVSPCARATARAPRSAAPGRRPRARHRTSVTLPFTAGGTDRRQRRKPRSAGASVPNQCRRDTRPRQLPPRAVPDWREPTTPELLMNETRRPRLVGDRRTFLRGAGLGLLGAGAPSPPAARRTPAPAPARPAVPPARFGEIAVQLSWIKNIEFAGEFMADSKGYYTDAGFSKVDLLAGGAAGPRPRRWSCPARLSSACRRRR